MLKKLFIRDYENTSDPEVRIRYGIVAGPTHTNILFDIVEPFGEHYDITRIETLLTEKFLEAHDPTQYYFVINVDKKMD